jgi:L-fuconolactonase
MEIVDAQLHVLDRHLYETSPDPDGILALVRERTQPVETAEMLSAMNDAGVDAAILVSITANEWDYQYSTLAASLAPERFRVVARCDEEAPDIGDIVERWAADPSTVGLRTIVGSEPVAERLRAGAFEAFFDAAERVALPVWILAPTSQADLADLAARRDELRIVVDHFGLSPARAADGTDPFELLPSVLALAKYPNVVLKVTGGAILSREPFPFSDLWPVMHRIVDAFGPERLLWGTDWTRVPQATFPEAVRWFSESDELSPAAKEQMMGTTARTVFNWPA